MAAEEGSRGVPPDPDPQTCTPDPHTRIPDLRDVPSPTISSSFREWSRPGDFLFGNYSIQSGLWSATGINRQFPLVPVIDRFTQSQYTEGGRGQGHHSYAEDLMHQQNLRLSSRLPRYVWILLAKSLGIKLHHLDKPIFATILHVLTLTAAMTFAIPGCWYVVYDIQSKFSKTTVLIGTTRIIIGFGWSCIGVYAHNLAARLFHNRNFVECVRVHSKTFLKISSSWLTFGLGTTVMVTNLQEAAHSFSGDKCRTAEVDVAVCQVFFIGRVVYAFFCLLWNFIVAYVLFSVCRTHTIGIRRFMRELALDGSIYEDLCLKQYNLSRNNAMGNMLEESWFLWDDVNTSDSDNHVTLRHTLLQSLGSLSQQRRTSREQHHRGSVITTSTTDGGQPSPDDVFETLDPRTLEEDEMTESERLKEEIRKLSEEHMDNAPTILTNEDLLFSYWKFLRRLSVTSRCLQRWLASWMAMVLIWDGFFIIYWTSHKATLPDILQFILPLLLLLLVCSAYAEVNAEGQRLLKAVCPLQERLAVIFYFNEQPLSVKVFSFTVTYNAMMTVILGFSVAFASRMILDEISHD